MPFRASIGYVEPVALSVLLRLAAGRRSHDRQFAALARRKRKPVCEQRILCTLISAFGDRTRPRKQTYIVVDKQHSGRYRSSCKFRKKGESTLALRAYSSEAEHEIGL